MTIDECLRLYPEQAKEVAGEIWGVIDTKGPPGTPVLVMLPGTLGTARIFWNQIATLGGRIRVISLTYPLLDDVVWLSEALVRLLDRLGVGHASLLGSSLGGYLAQHFAARHAPRVDRLFIANSLCDPRGNPSRRPAEELRSIPAEMHRRAILESVASWSEPEPIFSELKSFLRDSGATLLSAEALKARVLAIAGGGVVPEIPMPGNRIVIIDCEDDPLISPAVRDDVVRRYPGAERVRMPVGGHYPYITRPDAYTAVIERALLERR
jgi:pimeloyl-ACP methyl ester carboxylesterase